MLPRESPVDRFLRYVSINTEALEGSLDVPSSPGQWDLARLLAAELTELGATDVRLTDQCIVYARIPSNLPADRKVPTIGLVAHVDTSPAVTGAGVRPVVHANYQGGDIVLPADTTQVIVAARHPVLQTMIGDDIITADGTSLLGSDDKSGVAAIMTLVDILTLHTHIPHGDIAIAFTSDEEIGQGVDHFDVEAFGADFAYTVDGDALGEINFETFNAAGAEVVFTGVSAHTGTARGEMVNSMYATAAFLAALPANLRPEAVSGRDGFVHPNTAALSVESSSVKLLLRDFDYEGLMDKERLVRRLAEDTARAFPGVQVSVDVREQYRNMNDVLQHHPRLVGWAMEAARRAGLTPVTEPIRGGTDGSRLTFKGLPCPNIFTGGYNFHSKLEFNSRRGLEKTTETLVNLVSLVAERPE
jgi:tripeptide aminopeptidase